MSQADSTVVLLEKARTGDREALESLLARYVPPLRRWAAGRLPAHLRGPLDTHDVVQDAVLQTLGHIERFEQRHDGALRAYLRQAVLNRIRDELRRAAVRPAGSPIRSDHPADGPSPLEAAIGREGAERYEAALSCLKDGDREAIIARLELGCTYEEVAEALEKPTPAAARMAVQRAVVRLVEEMKRGRRQPVD
jgi:RNA polymerase sigma-70 factor (ECF subfamily)